MEDWSVLKPFVHNGSWPALSGGSRLPVNALKLEFLKAILWKTHFFSIPSDTKAFDTLGNLGGSAASEASVGSPVVFQVLDIGRILRMSHVKTNRMIKVKSQHPFMIQMMQVSEGSVDIGKCTVFPTGLPELTDMLHAFQWEHLATHLTHWSVSGAAPGHAGCIELTDPNSVANRIWTVMMT